MDRNSVQLEFQSAKALSGGGDLPSAVDAALRTFQARTAQNITTGEASFVTTVAVFEETYFGIVIAGPFESLESLQAALAEAVAPKPMKQHLGPLGLR